MYTGFYKELCEVFLNPCHKYVRAQNIPYDYVQASYDKNLKQQFCTIENETSVCVLQFCH